MVMEGNLGGEHTMQYRDDVLWNCTFKTILITNVSPINLFKNRF